MTWYLQLNLALVALGTLAILASHLNISSRQKLKLHYLMIVLAMLILPVIGLLPEVPYEYPIREVLNSPLSMATHGISLVHDTISSSNIPRIVPYRFEYISFMVYLIIFAIACLIPWKTFITYSEIRKSYKYKKIGRANVLISEKMQSPYAFSFLTRSFVVMPQFLLNDMDQFNLALKHEFQHIRNHDTIWIYLFELVLSVCFLNPIIYFWRKQVLLDQEFACDESLIAHKKVSRQAYATCLLQVAESTIRPRKLLYGATGMAWGEMKSQLSRRIEKMRYIKSEKKTLFNTIIAASLLIFSLSVFGLQMPMSKITMNQLKSTVNISDFSEFPLELNEHVLAELNRFSSNTKWKEFTRQSLRRYKSYKHLIDSKAKQYNLPIEIAAVAFIESGFKNLPDRKTSISSKGAGMWQFIPRTARKYGLVVEESIDERLNIPMATDAAMRYLADNRHKLSDLRLALMGYYFGENRILKDTVKYGTLDPWILIEQGGYNTPYLARVMAAAILIKYPSIIL